MKCWKATACSRATAVAALCMSSFIGTGGWAQAAHPCESDIEKLCGTVQPGGGHIAACLKEHAADLSPACKTRVAQLKQQLKQVKEACQDDVVQLCPGVKPGHGRVMACLKGKQAELSDACKDVVAQMKQMKH